MKRLIEKGLMFGGMIHVDSPLLVGRYNRALERLTGKRTALTDFHIDLSGYAPEIGDELADSDYLNAAGCNRQFILLSVEQKRAPLLNMAFSTARPILRDWILANESALFALTARDAVAGELANSVFKVTRPAHLFDIRQIIVDADTTGGQVAGAAALADKIDTFRSTPGAWHDDALIAQMIDLARQTGDVTRNPVALSRDPVAHGNFWTRHFGGAYVFHNVARPFVIARDAKVFTADDQVPVRVIALDDAQEVARALHDNGLTQAIVGAPGIDAPAILRQKMAFILIDAAATRGIDLRGIDPGDLRALARTLGADIPEAYQGLAGLLRYIETGGSWPSIGPDHPAYFYALRGAPRADRDLVNMALAELAPLDVRQMFICHKDLFYATYAGWSDSRRALVAEYLEREYLADKAGMRDALFGGAVTPPAAPERRKGPWG